MFTVTFPCGGRLTCKDNPIPVASHIRAKDGAIRLCVYDSQASEGMQRPTLDDLKVAPCRFSCPKKRASGRKEIRCFPALPDDEIERLSAEGERMGYGRLPWRYVITCYGVVTKVEP